MPAPGDLIALDIEKPAAGGRMLARLDGQIVFVSGTIPGEHVHIFGWDENVFVFGVLSILMAGAMLVLRFGAASEGAHATR